MEHELILGRYRPLADLGEGGHGVVTLAYDTKMARRVAIKRIPLSHAGVRRLQDTTGLAEARTAAMLNHPNIVTVHEWDTDLDEAFLIMEYVDGASIAELLDEDGPLDLDEASRRQLVDLLQAAGKYPPPPGAPTRSMGGPGCPWCPPHQCECERSPGNGDSRECVSFFVPPGKGRQATVRRRGGTPSKSVPGPQRLGARKPCSARRNTFQCRHRRPLLVRRKA